MPCKVEKLPVPPVITALAVEKLVATRVVACKPVNVGLAVVRRSCGVAMLAYSVPTVTVTPYVPARLKVDPPVTDAVPLVPFSVNPVLIAADVSVLIRP